MRIPPAEKIELFWQRVEKTPACWIWHGTTLDNGYGMFSWWDTNEAKPVYERAHRLSYYLASGHEPAGHVCHTCDTPLCVNPAHLLDRDARWNVADRQAKGREARGERVHTAKLTEERVREIRRAHDDGESNVAIARAQGVTDVMVGLIVRRRSWKHVR